MIQIALSAHLDEAEVLSSGLHFFHDKLGFFGAVSSFSFWGFTSACAVLGAPLFDFFAASFFGFSSFYGGKTTLANEALKELRP